MIEEDKVAGEPSGIHGGSDHKKFGLLPSKTARRDLLPFGSIFFNTVKSPKSITDETQVPIILASYILSQSLNLFLLLFKA